jgi:hypothetical protein
VDLIGLAQGKDKWRALVNSVLNLRVPWNAGKFLSGYATGGLSSSAQLRIVSYSAGMYGLLSLSLLVTRI